ncbi:M28 family metallopeptidase [Phycicoccus flavus]|uniref:M28 family peptidase n=1 Tax=Phycicoccus flavus TaxID=2502783 RepID=A0A8T6QZR0_9MICO|nr:M28 family metallopeptidase [Phycicoccus flavus]NHA67609.1 M28 family peptidase [Phycicoccus flavus]
MPRTLLRAGAVVAAGALAATLGPSAVAGPDACSSRTNNTHAKLAECVTLEGVRAHQAALQAIADANNDTRVSGSPGYDESVEYVRSTLEKAGYSPTVQSFTYNTFITLSATVLEQVSPAPTGPVPVSIMSYSGSGDVTASVTALTPPPADATPGCEAADFAGFPAGNIALISRGGCTFAAKATNAAAAGASAVVIYNNQAGVLNGTLSESFALDLPVVSVTQDVGQRLAGTAGLVLRVKTDTFRGEATTYNVLAETAGGNADNVVMAGAHLDSVNAGPGINDNGSGTAALLETAVQMAKVKPVNKIRFAWWGAEESGLVGSTRYVASLDEAARDRIALYLNFDMVGSPNHVFFVYDGDDSDGVGAGPGPDGSARIEKTFEAFYSQRGIPFKGTDFSGRSDYGPFIAAGIPSGGLFTGAEGIKTPEEAQIWGGTAGAQYDPCYHQPCDTYANNNDTALDVNSDAIAFAVLQYGMNTSDVNGVAGKPNFAPVQPTTAGMASDGRQGGLHDEHEHLSES